MSHDLVNPTWGLQSYITGLAEDETSGIGRPEILEIKRSIDRLCLMLENLLYWSRIQAGGIAPSPRLVDCGKVVAQETHFLADLASTKGITVTLKDEAGSLALTDEHLLRIVARNLIQNAIKFTPVSGAVEVETGMEGAAPVVIVRDEGSGMPGDVFPAIERGAAISSARGSAGERGHGIGLAVCFELVRAVGGELSAAPRPGGGSAVRVRFGPRIEDARA
jgi:signal transduction histidine kinase